jgi:hypothetical protein
MAASWRVRIRYSRSPIIEKKKSRQGEMVESGFLSKSSVVILAKVESATRRYIGLKTVMIDLPRNHSLGLEFFRFCDLRPLSADGYFKCLNLLKAMFKDGAFAASTPGFYLNRITNTNDDHGNSVRLTYYTTDPSASLNAIQNFVAANNELAIFESNDLNRPDPASRLDTPDDPQLRFRNFLNRNTQICLDVLEGYGPHSFQELVTYYRYVFLPQRTPPEKIFGAVFQTHSDYFRRLREQSLDTQYWQDLVHLHPAQNYGLHFMVNMLAVLESAYDPAFWKEDWIQRQPT